MKKILFYCLLCIGVCVGCNFVEEEFVGQKNHSSTNNSSTTPTQQYPPLEDVDLFVYTETFDTIQINSGHSSPISGAAAKRNGKYMYNMLELKLERWIVLSEEVTECPVYAFFFLSPVHNGKRFAEGIYSQNAPVNTPWHIGKGSRIVYNYEERNADYTCKVLNEEYLSQCCMQIKHEGDEEHIKIWMEFADSEPTYRYVEITKKIDFDQKHPYPGFWGCEWWTHYLQ